VNHLTVSMETKPGLLVPVGAGRGAYYELPRKRLTNGSNGSPGPADGNGSPSAQSAQATPRPAAKKTTTSSKKKSTRKGKK
jgi:hypothetical protein